MRWSKKSDLQQERQQVPTEVWECPSENCLGWMRKDFSFEEEPKCPLCGTKMKSGERLLYILSN
jgi:hypothetical protein